MAALWARDTSLHARALAAAPAPVDPPPLTQPADTFAPDALRFVVYGCLPPDTLINLLTRPAFDILIIERDIAQFRRLLQLFDISSPLAHPRVRWCVSDDPVAISNAFYTWCHDLGSIAIHAIPPPASPDHAFYHALHERLDLVTARVQQDLATYRQNAEIFFRSAMANVNRVLTSHDLNPVTAWTAHHPLPALVLGAGPSLDDGLDSIAAFRARGWIVCTDSAWPALARRGIVPDCICTIDYSPRKASVFSAHPPGDILVVSVPDAFPDLLEHAKRLSFVSRGVPLSDRIGALVGGLPRFDEPISDVTQFAFLVARRLLGARAITLLGCDLCVKGDAHHARDAVAHATAPANASIKAPGVSGEVTTTPAFLNSRDVLTQYAAAALATTPPVRLINASDGLPIPGWEHLPLSEALSSEIASNPDISDARQRLAELPVMIPIESRLTEWNNVQEQLRKRLGVAESLADAAAAAADTLRRGDYRGAVLAARNLMEQERRLFPADACNDMIQSLSIDLRRTIVDCDRLTACARTDQERLASRLNRSHCLAIGVRDILLRIIALQKCVNERSESALSEGANHLNNLPPNLTPAAPLSLVPRQA